MNFDKWLDEQYPVSADGRRKYQTVTIDAMRWAWNAAADIEREECIKICKDLRGIATKDNGEDAAQDFIDGIRERSNVNVTGAARLHRAASVLTAGLGPKRYERTKPPTRPKRHQAKLRQRTKPPACDDARKDRAKPPAMSQARALCLWPRMGDGVGISWVSRPQAQANN